MGWWQRRKIKAEIEENKLTVQKAVSEAATTLVGNIVDPRDAFFDPFDGFGTTTGGVPLGFDVGDRKRGEDPDVFRNEHELDIIRRTTRKIAAVNEFAINGHENLISYIVGVGMQHRVVRGKNVEEDDIDDSVLIAGQDALDEFMDDNDWSDREQEAIKRCDRDGEAFFRLFILPEGKLAVRFVEPDQVRAPGKDGSPVFTFGIETDPEDIETVLAYHIEGNKIIDQLPERVEAKDVVHIKINTDRNVKRGMPTFWPVRSNLDRAEKLLRNMSTVAAIQSAIALVRKHSANYLKSQVQGFADNQKDFDFTNSFSGKTHGFRRMHPGMIIDLPAGIDYDYPAAKVNAADMVAVLQADLRAVAARLQMPEFMFTSDASNANFASTLVAEGPAVKTFERKQAFYSRQFRIILWRALELAAQHDRFEGLTPEVLELLDIQSVGPNLVVRDKLKDEQANQILSRNGVLSKITWSARSGLNFDSEQINMDEEQGGSTPLPLPPGGGGDEEDDDAEEAAHLAAAAKRKKKRKKDKK